MSERLIQWQSLFDFVRRVMTRMGVPVEGSRHIADNLVLSNLRGIDSHGVARLPWYVTGIKEGYILPKAIPKVVRESNALASVDGGNGPGQVAGAFAMELAISKAKEEGIGLVGVYNSNHYGFAGYYPLMALSHNLIGISMTNAWPLAVPTFGRNATFGTNPIAIAVPAGDQKPWVLDMATSVVTIGRLEVYDRMGDEIPVGWALDEDGHTTRNPREVLDSVYGGSGAGGVLPLGGEGELHGGHKGYGLAIMVDILCGVLTGANFGPSVMFYENGKYKFPNTGHIFAALDPVYFIGLQSFKQRMDEYLVLLKNSEKAEGESRIFVHGEKEYEENEHRGQNGVPLDPPTTDGLKKLSRELDEPILFMD
ncbi:MAG: Ldh family oxidoreductase [Candidatus Thorarchaeota archaeon]